MELSYYHQLTCSTPAVQIVKYFLDPKTFQKVKFVYPKNDESLELMRVQFDVEILPSEFGGRNVSQYDHEEFSSLMTKDEVKVAGVREQDDKLNHTSKGHSTAEVAPEPMLTASQSD